MAGRAAPWDPRQRARIVGEEGPRGTLRCFAGHPAHPPPALHAARAVLQITTPLTLLEAGFNLRWVFFFLQEEFVDVLGWAGRRAQGVPPPTLELTLPTWQLRQPAGRLAGEPCPRCFCLGRSSRSSSRPPCAPSRLQPKY